MSGSMDIDSYLGKLPADEATLPSLAKHEPLHETERLEFQAALRAVNQYYGLHPNTSDNYGSFKDDRVPESLQGDGRDTVQGHFYNVIDLGVRTVGSGDHAVTATVFAQPFCQTYSSHETKAVERVVYGLMFAIPHAGLNLQTVGSHLHSMNNDMLRSATFTLDVRQVPGKAALASLTEFMRLCQDVSLTAGTGHQPGRISFWRPRGNAG